MKKLDQYLTEAEQWMESPGTGDYFDIELADDTLLETYVMQVAEDGSVLLDSTAEIYGLLESWDMLSDEDTDAALTETAALAESHFAVGDRVKCRTSGMKGHVVKLDKDHGAADDRYYTVKRDNGQLRKMAPKDMTKINEAAPLVAMVGGALARQAMGAAIDRKQETEPVNELEMEINPPEQDANEYDQEGDAAKTELHTMIRAARRLIGMLDDDENMPEWTQKKITKATDYVDSAADYIESNKERGVMEGDSESNPVARAVLHRIMMQHPGVLATHGPEQVMAAVDELADRVNIGPDDEIGSSDVSGWTRDVIRMLAELPDEPMNVGDDLDEQGMAEDFDKLSPQQKAHEYNLDVAQREMDRRHASGEDMTGAKIDKKTYKIIKPKPGVAEGPNDGKEDNFTIDDIKNLERIRDLETLKAQAKELIKGKPARRMKPEKISWFYNHIDTLKNPLAVIKMMYDLMLAGEGNKVIGSRNSMSSNSYRSKFGEQDVSEDNLDEAEYQGRKVQLNKKMSNTDGKSKSKVYVRDPKTGNVKKVTFGDPNMRIRKSNPGARKSFRARHNCDNPGPKTKARYWSCRSW